MSARLQYTWDVGSIGPIDWGLGVGVAYVDLELDLETDGGFDDPADSFDGPVPLALRSAVERGRWATHLEASGMP